MKNAFAVHGIEHLSPSSLNQYAAAPAAFVLQRILKRPVSVGPAAHRGTSAESGVLMGLLDPLASVSACVERAMEQFRTLTALSTDPRIQKESDAIPGFVAEGIKALRPYGPLRESQTYAEHRVEGLPVPIIGYSDFIFESGVLFDLKTTHAVSSKISTTHARQVSLYTTIPGVEKASILYASSKKSAAYELENAEQHLKALEKIALTLQRFLSISDDPNELAALVVPDVDSFYFGDDVTRQAAFEVWGI